MKRYLVRAEARPRLDGWQVAVSRLDAGAAVGTPLSGPRRIERTSADTRAMPRLSADEAEHADPDYPADLATDVSALHRRLQAVLRREANSAQIAEFARWLFHTLIGRAAWNAILADTGGESIELVLSWAADDWALHRLPWEMMRLDSRHLAAAEPLVAFSRVVPGPVPVPVPLAPRVLFAVGTALDDPAVQPGAEYYAILRQRETATLAPEVPLLADASLATLQQAVARERPGVLHLATHGRFGGGRGTVTLRGAAGQPLQDVTAAQLAAVLRAASGGALPPIVLSACDTGSAGGALLPLDPEAPGPFAAELIQEGVPLVVAMTGRIADRACRLFAKAFYRALFEGREWVEAAALGRRAGFVEGTPSVDWALPAIFMPEGPRATHTPTAALAQKARRAMLDLIASSEDPRALSGRLPILDAFRSLMADDGASSLVLVGPRQEAEQNGRLGDGDPARHRFGFSRLLRELSRCAIRAGHLPLLVRPPASASQVVSLPGFCGWLITQIAATYEALGKDLPLLAMRTLARIDEQRPAKELPPELPRPVRDALDDVGGGPPWQRWHPLVLRAALRFDLDVLLNTYLNSMGDAAAPAARCVVLIDDVEKLGDDVVAALTSMIGAGGFGGGARPIPAVLAFDPSASVRATGRDAAVARLVTFVQQGAHARRVPVGLFSDAEWRNAYQVWLLHLEKGFAIDPNSEVEKREMWLALLHSLLRGIPNRLGSVALETHERAQIAQTMLVGVGLNVLIRADDEVWLTQTLGPPQ
jgi:hypothetical protein